MRLRLAALAMTGALASPLCAETDFTRLTEAERAIFHAEIRAVLMAHPEIVSPPSTMSAYDAAVADDLALIAAHREALFGPGDATASVAFFTRDKCDACETSLESLELISEAYGVTFMLLDMDEQAGLAAALGLTQAPAYVFEDMMFQGAMPAPVLERYLSR